VVCLPVNLPNVFICSLDFTTNVGRQIMGHSSTRAQLGYKLLCIETAPGCMFLAESTIHGDVPSAGLQIVLH